MLITVRTAMCHLCMALLGTISVNRRKLCWTRRGSDLPSPLWEPHRDYEKHGHKTFIIIKGSASFEGGLWVRLRFFFPSLYSVKPFSNSYCGIKVLEQLLCLREPHLAAVVLS